MISRKAAAATLLSAWGLSLATLAGGSWWLACTPSTSSPAPPPDVITVTTATDAGPCSVEIAIQQGRMIRLPDGAPYVAPGGCQ